MSAGCAVQQRWPVGGEKEREGSRTVTGGSDDGGDSGGGGRALRLRRAQSVQGHEALRVSGSLGKPKEPAHQPIGVGWGFVGTEP